LNEYDKVIKDDVRELIEELHSALDEKDECIMGFKESVDKMKKGK
jgi:hypothetical protein